MCRKSCCKYCCAFFPPILVALQLGGWRDQPELVREVGKTYFAKTDNYEAFTLTDRHRDEFFRDGATLLKGVLKPEVVKKLHEYVAPIDYFDPRNIGNLWMMSDEILDFYLFGPLGDIARQVFQSPQAVTAHLAPSAQLQRDFISRRHLNSTNGWHIDRTECQMGDQPSKYLSTALARLAVPLIVEGGVRGTQIINQSKYAAAMSEGTREEYLAGKSMYRKEGRFEQWMLWDPDTAVPVLPGVKLDEEMIIEHWMEPGDIVLFNTCLWHCSPPWVGPEQELGLQPTYAPSNHIAHDPPTYTDMMASWCLYDEFAGKPIGEVNSSCYPYAYPEDKRPKVGSTLTLKRRPQRDVNGKPVRNLQLDPWLSLEVHVLCHCASGCPGDLQPPGVT
ncbi:unnamed protein product [Cladocopium goreaui]|uniref:Phytanoyl-CoA dioxygenase n=1 Tax=Cladocopium goreaui TaxID=2562237 RepID=A0A9P1GKM3_9DINO|nr:unnamed protein product [Cladocopium goreaui]